MENGMQFQFNPHIVEMVIADTEKLKKVGIYTSHFTDPEPPWETTYTFSAYSHDGTTYVVNAPQKVVVELCVYNSLQRYIEFHMKRMRGKHGG